MLLTDILEKSVQRFPDKAALTMLMGYRTVSLSYADTHELSLKVARFLQKSGLQRGDKVLLLAPNSPYWICAFWGCILAGVIPVPLNIQSTPEMVRKIAEQTGAKLFFKHLHWKQEAPAAKSYDVEFLNELVADSDEREFQKVEVTEQDVAQIMYTSGTTGDPKGVILTHKNMSSNVEALSAIVPISSADRFLSVLPLSHIFEQTVGFFLPFYNGAEIVYAHSPAAIRDLLKEHRVTKMAAVPEFLKIFMDKVEASVAEREGKRIFEKMMNFSLAVGNKTVSRFLSYSIHKSIGGKLDTVASGGAPLDRELEKKWNALGIDLLQGYGLTETSPILSCNTYKNHRLGSAGRALPGVELRIADDGEILAKGPGIFQAYFKNEQKTKEAFTAEGWFKTDDLGEFDKEGFLYIKGRKKYMIKGPGAQNVYPEDIEFELNKIPGVKDSCVVGLEKPGGFVEIHAVLLGEIAEPEKIIEQANKNLASYQRITGWSLWPQEDFPRSATRKVKKEEVIKWLKSREEKPSAVRPVEKKSALEYLLSDITGVDAAFIHGSTKIVPELRLDSLLRIELVSRIEEKFGVMIDESKITAATTVSDTEKMIKAAPLLPKRPAFKRWPLSSPASLIRTAGQIFFVFPVIRMFVKLRVEGLEHLKDLPLPAVFMPNHLSYLDSAAAVMALPAGIRKRIAFAAAVDVLYETYRRVAWLAELLFNAFPFPRREHEEIGHGLEYMGKLLDKNWSIVVYPEGQMSLTGELQPLKRGAGLIAIDMDSFVVPMKISGTQRVLPPNKLVPRKRGEVAVKFGRPMKFKRSDSYLQATEQIHRAMSEL